MALGGGGVGRDRLHGDIAHSLAHHILGSLGEKIGVVGDILVGISLPEGVMAGMEEDSLTGLDLSVLLSQALTSSTVMP